MLDEQFKHDLSVQKLWLLCCIWWSKEVKELTFGLVAPSWMSEECELKV